VLIVPRPVPSAIPGRAEDPAVPWTLAALRSPGIEAAEAPVTFDGGDLVADESRVYLTPAAARRDPTGAGGDARAIRDALAAVLDRDVLLLADDPADAPDHHIGMFVTPLGRGTVLVGDPRAARGLLTGTAAALVPDADLSDASAARFDAAAESLGRAGLRVLRIPLVPTHTPYVWLGYNNVLIDDRADGRHVLQPQYDVPSLDRAGRTAWEDLGFVVHPIDVSRLYRHGGAVRCLAAVLSRDPAPERAGAPTRFAAPIRTAGR
jgi:hypothetical protein